jgi:DNA-binding transcriptional regulator YhcF (GntR family)
MAAAYASGQYTMREIAQHFGVHYATVRRAIRAMELERKVENMRDCKT